MSGAMKQNLRDLDQAVADIPVAHNMFGGFGGGVFDNLIQAWRQEEESTRQQHWGLAKRTWADVQVTSDLSMWIASFPTSAIISRSDSAAKEVTLELVPQGFCANECRCRAGLQAFNSVGVALKLAKERRALSLKAALHSWKCDLRGLC